MSGRSSIFVLLVLGFVVLVINSEDPVATPAPESKPTDKPSESTPSESKPTDKPSESSLTDKPSESKPTDKPTETSPTDALTKTDVADSIKNAKAPGVKSASGKVDAAKFEKVSNEGECFKKWPKPANIDLDWFETTLLAGFRVPMASKQYYLRYAKQLTKHRAQSFEEKPNLKEMCLRVTNNPSVVFSTFTGAPLPENWETVAKDDDTSGSLLYNLANTATNFFFNRFFLAHLGFGAGMVENCKANKQKGHIKECQVAEGEIRGQKKLRKDELQENRWEIVKTNNKTYAIAVSCFVKENKKAWHLLFINKTLTEKRQSRVRSFITKLGFNATKAVYLSYEDKHCHK